MIIFFMRKVQLILLIFFAIKINAQERLSFSISKDSSLDYILNNIVKIKKFETRSFSIQLYVVSNPSSSARISGNDEVTDNIYVATSEFDETPNHHLFVLKDIYSGRDNISFKENKNETVDLKIEYYNRILRKKEIHLYNISITAITEIIN